MLPGLPIRTKAFFRSLFSPGTTPPGMFASKNMPFSKFLFNRCRILLVHFA